MTRNWWSRRWPPGACPARLPGWPPAPNTWRRSKTKVLTWSSAITRCRNFDGLAALRVARERSPRLPFIFVTGTLGAEQVVESMQNGATDCVLKERLSRLCPAVRRALRGVQGRAEQAEMRTEQAETRTVKAEARTETSRGAHGTGGGADEQAETRTEQAKTRTEQAEARTEQAETIADGTGQDPDGAGGDPDGTSGDAERAGDPRLGTELSAAVRSGQGRHHDSGCGDGAHQRCEPFPGGTVGSFPGRKWPAKPSGNLSLFKDIESNRVMLARLQKGRLCPL